MTKVFQTQYGKGGNCLQACVASLLDLKLEDVPHFFEAGKDWNGWRKEYTAFLESAGYSYESCWKNPYAPGIHDPQFSHEEFNDILGRHGGVNGYFIGVVLSPSCDPQAFFNSGIELMHHAVIVDTNWSIVHDPNINYAGVSEYPMRAMISFNGITELDFISRKEQ